VGGGVQQLHIQFIFNVFMFKSDLEQIVKNTSTLLQLFLQKDIAILDIRMFLLQADKETARFCEC
jgi:hypothetical protein